MFIDINCDMGEGMPNDAAIMPFISSANIACGYHAGNEDIMQTTIHLAQQHGVAIGAHPGFPDKENFGRIPMQLSSQQITALIQDQVSQLMQLAHRAGTRVVHVKPHGALYNMSAANPELALTIAQAIHELDADLIVVGLCNSHSISTAQAMGLRTASEAFADRHYLADGSLVPRSDPRALIGHLPDAAAQVLEMIETKKVTPVNGYPIPLQANTICIHGDGVHAPALAEHLFLVLKQKGISIKPLAH